MLVAAPEMPTSEMNESTLTARLPETVAACVRSLKLNEGRVTVILDGSGLDAAAREALEAAVTEVLSAGDGVAEVRVAIMADKPEPKAGPVIVAVGSGKGGVGKSTL